MPLAEHDGGALHYQHLDFTPPWVKPGPAVLFLHGVGTDMGIWSDWLPVLGGRFPLIRFDMRGHGGSHRPGRGHGWSFEGLAADALAVAEAAGAAGRRLILVGESLGGTLALTMALRGWGDVAAVIACSTAHRGARLRNVESWRGFMRTHGMAAWSRDMMDRRFATGAVGPDVWDWFHRTQSACDGEAILDLADLLIGVDLSDELPTLPVPLLLFAPEDSPFIPLEIPRALAAAAPAAELLVLAGARHGIACSHGRACAKDALAFLARHGLA